MRRVDALLADYGSYHRTRGNLVCHALGIPLIVFGVIAFLRLVPLGGGGWSAAELVIAATVVYYATLDVPLALAMLVPLTARSTISGIANMPTTTGTRSKRSHK